MEKMIIQTVEMEIDGKFEGYAPMKYVKGEKPKMILKKGEPVIFPTRKEAREYGMGFFNTVTNK